MNVNSTNYPNQMVRPMMPQQNYNQQRMYQPQPINQRVVNNLQNQNFQPQPVIQQPNQIYQNGQMYNQPIGQQNYIQRPIVNGQPVIEGNQQ